MIKKIYKKFHQTDCPLASLRAPPDASSPASAMQSTATALHSCAVSFAKSRSAGRRRPVARCCRQAPRRPAGPYSPAGPPGTRACSVLSALLCPRPRCPPPRGGRRTEERLCTAVCTALDCTGQAGTTTTTTRPVAHRTARRQRRVPSCRAPAAPCCPCPVPSSVLRPPPTGGFGFPRARPTLVGPGGQRLGEARGGRLGEARGGRRRRR
jgi:hypothetical protein